HSPPRLPYTTLFRSPSRRAVLGVWCAWCEFSSTDNDHEQGCGDDPSAPPGDVGVQGIKDAVCCDENHEQGCRSVEATVCERCRPDRPASQPEPPEDATQNGTEPDHRQQPQPARSCWVVIAQQNHGCVPQPPNDAR